MYIIHEALASNDPRLQEGMDIVGGYWHYTIRYLAKPMYLEWLPHEVISEDIAYAYKLTGSYRGVISLSEPVTSIKDIQQSSGDTEYKKYSYRLTSQDKLAVAALKKACMRLYTKAHCKNQKQIKKLLNIVNSCNTIEDCNQVQYDYFNMQYLAVHTEPRAPEFKVDWDDF